MIIISYRVISFTKIVSAPERPFWWTNQRNPTFVVRLEQSNKMVRYRCGRSARNHLLLLVLTNSLLHRLSLGTRYISRPNETTVFLVQITKERKKYRLCHWSSWRLLPQERTVLLQQLREWRRHQRWMRSSRNGEGESESERMAERT